MNHHKGVGVIITNPQREVFYLQQKDDHYPVPEYRLCYSFFGGAIEAGETSLDALKRELEEELHKDVAALVFSGAELVHRFDIRSHGKTYTFTLYEAVVPEVLRIAEYHVLEGAGVMKTRSEISRLPFIWGLEQVVTAYLQRTKND